MAVSTVASCSGPEEPEEKALVLALASCVTPDRKFELPAPESFTPARFISLRMVNGPCLRDRGPSSWYLLGL